MNRWCIIDTAYGNIVRFVKARNEPYAPRHHPEAKLDPERYIVYPWLDTPLYLFERYRNTHKDGVPPEFDPEKVKVEDHDTNA